MKENTRNIFSSDLPFSIAFLALKMDLLFKIKGFFVIVWEVEAEMEETRARLWVVEIHCEVNSDWWHLSSLYYLGISQSGRCSVFGQELSQFSAEIGFREEPDYSELYYLSFPDWGRWWRRGRKKEWFLRTVFNSLCGNTLTVSKGKQRSQINPIFFFFKSQLIPSIRTSREYINLNGLHIQCVSLMISWLKKMAWILRIKGHLFFFSNFPQFPSRNVRIHWKFQTGSYCWNCSQNMIS